MDLLGCGDSSGDFADARWEIWKKDVRAAIEWLGRELRSPVSLWGLRIGASLAAEVARDPGLGLERLLLWQPVNSGEQFLTQFLRLRLAAEMLAEGSAQSGVRELRQTLLGGRPLEVAGYEVSPELAHAIDHLRLAESAPAVPSVLWLEVSGSPGGAVAPASQRTLDVWRSKGIQADSATVAGAPFWSTVEITECPELIAATMQWVQSRS
jgi:exosortase A-associated hydrolase 2